MELTPKTKLNAVLDEYPFLVEFLAGYNPTFAGLTNPVLRSTLAKTATLARIAVMGHMPVDELLTVIRDKIAAESGHRLEFNLGDAPLTREGRREVLAGIIRDLHAGADRTGIKHRFNELIEDVGAGEIGEMEQALIEAGMPESEITKLCDVHMDIFRESLQEAPPIQVPPGHPVDTFLRENAALSERVDELAGLVGKLDQAARKADDLDPRISKLLTEIELVKIHYLRKENQLFPFLEKHGVSGPPQVMWTTHDAIRGQFKEAKEALKIGRIHKFKSVIHGLLDNVKSMIEKENLVLWPMALEKLTEHDWVEMRQGEAHIGYALVKPAADWPAPHHAAPHAASTHHAAPLGHAAAPRNAAQIAMQHGAKITGTGHAAAATPGGDEINLDTGMLTPEQINLLFNHLPVEISFTDEEHRVRYFSEGRDRIFPRSPGVIGRHVEKCHPPKSVHMVKEILSAFESGRRDVAEFWLMVEGRFIHIRYFAVRDAAGRFRGTMEVVQDVSGIRRLEGSRTLLEWE